MIVWFSHSQATDKDTAIYSQITFEVTQVQFVTLDNEVSQMRSLFEAVTTQQNNVFIGIIQWVQTFTGN